MHWFWLAQKSWSPIIAALWKTHSYVGIRLASFSSPQSTSRSRNFPSLPSLAPQPLSLHPINPSCPQNRWMQSCWPGLAAWKARVGSAFAYWTVKTLRTVLLTEYEITLDGRRLPMYGRLREARAEELLLIREYEEPFIMSGEEKVMLVWRSERSFLWWRAPRLIDKNIQSSVLLPNLSLWLLDARLIGNTQFHDVDLSL